MVTYLMISAKSATQSLLKIKVRVFLLRNKGYDFIIVVYDITNKILSRK